MYEEIKFKCKTKAELSSAYWRKILQKKKLHQMKVMVLRAVSTAMGREKIRREERRNAVKCNMQAANHICDGLCLGYTAFIFSLCFLCISSLSGSSRADSPRAENTGFPASSVYCPGFLAEAMLFYLLVFFWFNSWGFGLLPPEMPETSLPFHHCISVRSLLHPGVAI